MSSDRGYSELIIGTWTSDCLFKRRFRIAFNIDGTGELSFTNYGDIDCLSRKSWNVVYFHYHLGKDVDLGGGDIATEIDIIGDAVEEHEQSEPVDLSELEKDEGLRSFLSEFLGKEVALSDPDIQKAMAAWAASRLKNTLKSRSEAEESDVIYTLVMFEGRETMYLPPRDRDEGGDRLERRVLKINKRCLKTKLSRVDPERSAQ